MALAAIYDGRSSKVTAKFVKGFLAIDTWNSFEGHTVRAMIPPDHLNEFIEDLTTIITVEVASRETVR